MKTFIMNWNVKSSTEKQAEYFTQCGHDVIIVDNRSTYKSLLDWYKTCPYKVISTEGVQLSTYNRFVWELDLHNKCTSDNYYAVTDSDLDFSDVPKDFAEVLIADIERNEGIIKSGLSLKLSDLPDNAYANRYRESEKNHFNNPDAYGFYDVPVDTTFAVYSKDRCNHLDRLWRPEGYTVPDSFLDNFYFYRSHRGPIQYQVRHLPWYMDINNLTEEEQYHIKVTGNGSVLHFKQVYEKELLEKYGISQTRLEV